jgi:Xaa-Pro aminopeptidase
LTTSGIGAAEFAQRRNSVIKGLKGAVGLVLAGEGAPPLMGKWRADVNFQYLTGIDAEPGAAVLFDLQAEDPKRRAILFLRPLNPEMEVWDGYRNAIGAALKSRTGFQTVMRTGAMPRLLTDLARRRGRLACLHPFSVYESPVSPDLALFRKVADRVLGAKIEDATNLLPSLRGVKSAAEVSLMRRAIEASALGFEAALAMLRPGVTEGAVQDAIERGFREGGASGPAYNSIVGSGVNGTVLHYMENTGSCADGDLLVIDAGARFGGYAADITRTYPVSGRFTKDQAKVYQTVLNAQQAAIRAVRPGVRMHQVDAAARAVIDKAGFGDTYVHGIGHQLGMEVHDVTPDGPLKAGMVVTIEPGVYLKDRGYGVRIEDDVLVTPGGSRVLSPMIAKSIPDIESAMARARKRVG